MPGSAGRRSSTSASALRSPSPIPARERSRRRGCSRVPRELPSLLEPLLAGTPGAPQIQSLPFLTAAEQLPDHRSRAWISRTRRRSPTIRSPPRRSRPWWSICAPRPSPRTWWGSFLWAELSRPSIRPQRRSFTAGHSSICSIRPTGGMTLPRWRPSPGFAICVRRWHRIRPAPTSTTSTPTSSTGRALLRNEPRATHADQGPVRSGRRLQRATKHLVQFPLRQCLQPASGSVRATNRRRSRITVGVRA